MTHIWGGPTGADLTELPGILGGPGHTGVAGQSKGQGGSPRPTVSIKKWRNTMDIEKELQEHISRMGDVNKQLMEIQKKIGTLQEEGKAIYNKGLELKGAIDALVGLQMKEKAALEKSATAKLTLPVGCKPIVTEETIEKAVEEGLKKLDADGTPEATATPAVVTSEGTIPPLEVV